MNAPKVPGSTIAPLVRQLSWSHNVLIFGQSKRPEERMMRWSSTHLTEVCHPHS
jgi:hypothetical protein